MGSPNDVTDDRLTLALTGVVSYLAANVVHEVLGHCAACLATGARITVLTSVFFRSEPASRLIAAGGPTANLLVGLVLWLWFLRREGANRGQPFSRFVLLFITVFNLCGAAGTLVQTGISAHGDWGFVIAGLQPAAFWRALLLAAGLVVYRAAILIMVRGLGSFVPGQAPNRSRRIRRLILWPYVAAGLGACLAATLDPTGMIGAAKGAAWESFAGYGPLLLVPPFMKRGSNSSAEAAIGRHAAAIVGIVIAYIFFALTFGRGMRFGS